MAQGNGEEIAWIDALARLLIDGHEIILRDTGGLPGEHRARLYSACARPFHTASGEELYRTVLLKAAALFHAIINDHPFADGNKRTATAAAIVTLSAAGYLKSDPTTLQLRILGELAVETALPGSLPAEEIADWFERILGPR